jgi:3-oxoacyl-[acyl-carrier protein] reductase
MNFEGKVALVTGGARGIGAATAARLARDGAAVVVSDLDLAPAQEVATKLCAGGSRAVAVAGDVSRRAAAEAMIMQAVEAFGRLDVLVTCAGIIRDNLVYKMTDDDWNSVIDTHLKGTFLCAQAAQRVMVQQRYGKMVFLSSTSALGNRGQANYSAAKAGIQGLARTLALELGKYNVTVNVVAPGFVETRMALATAERMGVDWETFKADMAGRSPLGRLAQPDDIASVIAFLCSDDSGFVSGQTLYVKGGP